uniref:Phosphatidylinositol phosphatase PTPRQ-like n=1 Tax=Crassostrea virginica TaxID=6565 RepID=A0A8B8D7N8_CRAVI|nr:phosphatidylinositol phosphatase PTPRQ-like [Crassostrea virginica]
MWNLLGFTIMRVCVFVHQLSAQHGEPAVVRFTTPKRVPSAPQNLRIEGTTPNTVTLRWDIPEISGVVSSYVLYYREDNGGPQMTETVDPPTLFYTVNDLSEGSRYHFDVAARSNNGEGPRSIPVEVKTIDFNPPHPLDLNCTSLNKTSVLLSWQKPLVLPGDGIIRGFHINYTDERYRDFFLFKTPTAEFTEAVISSLEPATVYYFQASSRTRKTFGGGGAVVMCQTKADAPSKPRSVQIELSRLDPPQLTLTWIPPYHTYGPLTNYTLHWGVKNGALRKEKIELYRLRWDSDYLDDATVHEFKLFAVNAEGFGEPAIVQFTTPKRETIVPPNVTVDNVKGPNNTTMLRVKWDPPNQPVEGYRILYRKFEWVYTGRWKLMELNDPNALSTEIVVDEPYDSHIVVVRGTAKRQNPNFPMMGQMNQHMMGSSVIQAPSKPRIIQIKPAIVQFTIPKRVPSAPQNLRIEGTTPNTVTLRWDTPEISEVVSSYVLYYREDNGGPQMTEIVDPPTLFYTVNDLSEGSRYQFDVAARSNNGEGPRSIPVEVKTIDFNPPHPLDFNCTSLNKTSVLLTWQKPLVLPGDGIIRGFHINYTDERYRDFFLFKTPTAEFTEAVISSLEPATVYYFQASSRTRKTFGGGGAVVMCQTKADAPSKPRNVQIELSRLDPPQLTLTWIPPYHTYGPLTNYTLHWGVKNGALRKEKIELYRLRWDSDYLDDATVHEFKLFAVNAEGFGEPAIVQFTTTKRETIVPPNVTVDLVKGPNNTNMLRVKWDPPNQPVEGYRILYRKFEYKVYTGRWKIKELNDPNALSTEIVVDEPYDSNIVVVRGTAKRQNPNFPMMGQMNQHMMGSSVIQAPSKPRKVQIKPAIVQFTTPKRVPSAPQNLRIEGTTPNTVTLRWDIPEISGVVSSYVLYYWEDNGGPQMTETVDPPTLFYTVNDLSEGSRYQFDVAARSNNGEGPRSIPVEVKTIDFNPPHPLDFNCTSLNKTSVLLTWQKPLVLPGDGIIRGFNINYTDERYRDFFLFKTPTAEFTEAVISSLEPATVYYFQASSRTRKTFGGGGAVVMCQTKADAPSKPRSVQIELSRLDPPQLTITWIPPYHIYGPLTNYTLHWGVKNGALRKEKIEPYKLRWDSDYLDDATVHEFKLFAVNAGGFGEPAIVQFTTPKQETIVPPNVTVDRVRGPNNTAMLRVKWDPPNQPVEGYRILYRKFERVYTGRWKLMELNDPNALSTEIVVDEPNYSNIVVVRGTAKRQNPNFPMMGQMNQQMMGSSVIQTPSKPRNVQIKPAVVQFTTPKRVPSAPQNLRIEGTTPNTVTLRWDIPEISEVVSSYVLYYWEDNGGPQMTETVDPPTLFYTVNDLSEGSRYQFDVAARSNNGEGPRSIPVEVKTIHFNPPHPLDFNCTSLNKTSVLLTWQKPLVLPGDGIIRGFNINYTDERYRDFFLFKTPTAEFTEAVISSLEPATVYYFQASSRTRKTFGGGGAVVMCQTKADAPSKPRSVQIELSRLDPPQLTITWIPPYHTYGPLTNYTLHWGVKNGALRKEKIEPYRLRWDSDYLDDATVHEFKLFAVNAEGFGKPAIVQFTTPKRETIVPPNVTVDLVKGPNNTAMLRVKWDPPNQPVEGYRILYRKFEYKVYTGRWKIKELNDPNALSTEIVVDEPKYSNIVVVRGTAKRQNPNFPIIGQMDQQMMRGGRMSQGNHQMSGSVMMSPRENGLMNPMMGGGMNPMANNMNQTIN